MANRRAVPEEKTCPRCNQKFLVGGRGRRRKNQIHCSRYCNVVARSRSVLPNNMSPVDASYLAGFIDGEGTIIQTDAEGKRKIWRIVVVNTHLETIEWILKVVGIGTISKRPIQLKEHHKPCYTWQVYGYKAKLVAEQLVPYLIQKKDKALQLIIDEQEKEDRMSRNRVNENDRRRLGRPSLINSPKRKNLSNADVLSIYNAKGIEKASALAKRYDVSYITIYDIQKGRTWKHVTGA